MEYLCDHGVTLRSMEYLLKNRMQIRLDVPRWRGSLALVLYFVLFTLAGAKLAAQSSWSAIGPAGGDARAFAAVPGQPNHIYLGTTNSWIYESTDRGASWHRLSKLDPSDYLVLDHIIVDPRNHAVLYVAAWEVGRTGGGLWISRDGGKSWSGVEGMRGQSIRALEQAPSDPKTLVVGTLDGVFAAAMPAAQGRRSARRGATRSMRWSRWRSIPRTPTSCMPAHGTCPGRRWTAARRGTASSRA